MKRIQAPVESTQELARLIRKSRALDPLLKRQWLRVLSHLSPADRTRLREILASDQAAADSGPRPTSAPS